MYKTTSIKYIFLINLPKLRLEIADYVGQARAAESSMVLLNMYLFVEN